jgi:integrase
MMVDRVLSIDKPADAAPIADQPTRTKGAPNRRRFTEENVRRLELPADGQVVWWDEKTTGLSVLLSQKTRTYRCTFILHGKKISDKIGRVGEVKLEDARKQVIRWRGQASLGTDPRHEKAGKETFGDVVERFITDYCKANQRTWDQTERALKVNCEKWWSKPIDTITSKDVHQLLDGFAREGHPYKARNTRVMLRKLYAWAKTRQLVKAQLIEGPDDYERRHRERVYSDDEVKTIWRAADKLNPMESAFVKLLVLLAPRKTALACMRRSQWDNSTDPTVWTTPHELTKSRKRLRDPRKRCIYVTPLPLLAIRILKGIPRDTDPDVVFPGLSVYTTKSGHPKLNTQTIVDRLQQHGFKGFVPHACRHTISTFLENEGHSEFERGLVLNHAGTSVTAGYSHGFAGKLKLELLTKWSDHVERLVMPAGVTLLR